MGDFRVGIDVSPLELTAAGTARYLTKLLEGLEEVDVRRYAMPGSSRTRKIIRDTAWYLAGLPRRAARDGVDVLHCTGHRGPLRSRVPVVMTIHDLAVLRFPETFNRWTRTYSRLLLPRVARAASRLIAVSEFTARDAVDLLGVDPNRVRVIPHGVDAPFTPAGPAGDGDYVLAVGTVEPRKNLERVVAAARRVGVELRVAGAPGWGEVRVETLGFVDDERLAELYRGAACLVYPTLYEGFGLPVLEAMACGTPVVTSIGSAPAQVADGAAVLVDPMDVEAIADGIDEAMRRREELRAAGIERARGYSWAAAAEATAAVYREAAA